MSRQSTAPIVGNRSTDPGADRRVPPGTTLLVGGARSGKSRMAVEMGTAWAGPVVFVATAQVPDEAADPDLAARVQRHRDERPRSWHTIEAGTTGGVLDAVRSARDEALVIVDCVTLWVAAAFAHDTDGAPTRTDLIESAAQALGEIAATRAGPTVLVSNEVGLGVHPTTDLGRRYRDTLGRVNATLGVHARRTLFLAAGRAVRLDDPWSALGP